MYKNYADRISCGSPDLFNSSGSRIVHTKHMEVTSKGYPNLVVDGEHNLYAEIQSYADQCDLQNVLANFDLSSGVAPMDYESAKGGVMDFVNPDNVGEPVTVGNWFNDARACDDYFARLPLAVRKEFDHSVINFERAVCDGSVFDVFKTAYGITDPSASVTDPVASVTDSVVTKPVSGVTESVTDDSVSSSTD